MAVKNVVFMQNWKKTFFAIFDRFWPQKVQIRNSLNSILVKIDRNYIVINFVTSRANYSEIIENK